MLGESDFFGEMSLLDGAGRSANVVALESSEVLTLARNDFLEILQEYPKISISLLEELTQRIRKSDQQIESLSLSDVEQRIGITLIRLAEELGILNMELSKLMIYHINKILQIWLELQEKQYPVPSNCWRRKVWWLVKVAN
ncbi:MAG: hypothetical protein CM1200mP10_14350 [Candidatus Neomarinimicrobiota bacterium]|nr:MAG: hypothetical protein CM1200mP10_14350 [Candidatus Neomarinimicrobiota bacterium]